MNGFMEIWWRLGLVGDVQSGDIFYCYQKQMFVLNYI